MTDPKTIHEEAERDFVTNLENWRNLAGAAQTRIRQAKSTAQGGNPGIVQNAGDAEGSLEQLITTLDRTKQNLEAVKEILEVRKASYEIKKVVVESWPRRVFTERLSYIATALYPIGGATLVLSGSEVTNTALFSTAAIWLLATILLLGSLGQLFLDDREKWKYFSEEFEVRRPKKSGKPRWSNRNPKISK